MINFDSLNENEWNHALALYNTFLSNDDKSSRDARVTIINAISLRFFSNSDFFEYLQNEFFVWKYTAPNRLKTTLNQLRKMSLEDIETIREGLLDDSTKTDEDLIKIAKKIKGLGVAGATALLSTLYPHRFATIDQFVVKNLQNSNCRHSLDPIISNTNPNNIKLREALYILNIIRDKANELNTTFHKKSWTPRAIDKAIWADR